MSIVVIICIPIRRATERWPSHSIFTSWISACPRGNGDCNNSLLSTFLRIAKRTQQEGNVLSLTATPARIFELSHHRFRHEYRGTTFLQHRKETWHPRCEHIEIGLGGTIMLAHYPIRTVRQDSPGLVARLHRELVKLINGHVEMLGNGSCL